MAAAAAADDDDVQIRMKKQKPMQSKRAIKNNRQRLPSNKMTIIFQFHIVIMAFSLCHQIASPEHADTHG